VRGWFEDRQQYDEAWLRAAFSTESWLTLTPERLDELSRRIQELVREYYDDPSTGEDAEPVYVFAHGVPARP
jgi:broad specificity phosphatase PhoE